MSKDETYSTVAFATVSHFHNMRYNKTCYAPSRLTSTQLSSPALLSSPSTVVFVPEYKEKVIACSQSCYSRRRSSQLPLFSSLAIKSHGSDPSPFDQRPCLCAFKPTACSFRIVTMRFCHDARNKPVPGSRSWTCLQPMVLT
jgi:hypothetical protein